MLPVSHSPALPPLHTLDQRDLLKQRGSNVRLVSPGNRLGFSILLCSFMVFLFCFFVIFIIFVAVVVDFFKYKFYKNYYFNYYYS